MSDRKKRPVLSKLKVIPVAVASVILFVLLSLLGLLNFNTPGTSDSSNGTQEQPGSTPSSQVSATLIAESVSPEKIDDVSDQPNTEPMQLVDVLIDGDQYWVVTARASDQVERETRTLAEIRAACAEVDGDESGVKARITRTFSATAQAEQTLVSALTSSGITEDEIDQRRTLVPRPSSIGQSP